MKKLKFVERDRIIMGGKWFVREESPLHYFITYGSLLLLGILLGMLLQQSIFKSLIITAGYSFAGTISELEVNVDINETKLVERFNETIQEIITRLDQNRSSGEEDNTQESKGEVKA